MSTRYERVTALGGGAPWAAGAAGALAGGYAALVCAAWLRYGRPPQPRPEEHDPLLDTFMPRYDVAERHHVQVHAPAAVVLDAAKAARLESSPLVRAIFRVREIVLRASPGPRRPLQGLLDDTLSLGWGVLAEVPGREIVVGAVTQPWLADVVFRALPPDQFRALAEPGYVKIIWTLRADPAGADHTVFRTETRVATTDHSARQRFRWYWARFSPGIVLIRRAMMAALKREAERSRVDLRAIGAPAAAAPLQPSIPSLTPVPGAPASADRSGPS